MNRIALLLVQIVVGYEWLVSGLTKVVHGNFPTGLAGTVDALAKTAPSFYGDFLTRTVAPHASAFAYAIEWSELATGAVLLATATIFLRHDRAPAWLGVATACAVFAGLVLAVNFELANGGGFGTRLGSSSFDEGIDLDTLMVALHLALLVPAVRFLRSRPALRGSVPAGVHG